MSLTIFEEAHTKYDSGSGEKKWSKQWDVECVGSGGLTDLRTDEYFKFDDRGDALGEVIFVTGYTTCGLDGNPPPAKGYVPFTTMFDNRGNKM
ncbi:MAG: hypothetical protein KA436_05725 [Oligoflexales bacterium]|nr:hypothetical protein [Oligoflexales bacterium]